MQTFCEQILENLMHTGIGMALFIVCYLSNMAFGIWYNTRVLNQAFEWNRIRESGIKLAGFGIGTVLMCIGVTAIPLFCDAIGLTLPEEYSEIFQKLAIVSVFIYSAARYLMEAYSKFQAILADGKGNGSIQ